MKISFPHEKRRIKLIFDASCYVVICQFRDGKWSIASFFGLPFASGRYHKAVKMKKEIYRTSPNVWAKDNFAIAKITL